MQIDVNRDMGADAPEGFSGEQYCETLHKYHKQLWSKKLPSGADLRLCLDWKSYNREPDSFSLPQISPASDTVFASDVMCPTYLERWTCTKDDEGRWIKRSMPEIREQLSKDEKEAFEKISTTIGNYIIFPKGKRISQDVNYGSQTKTMPWGINRARGRDEKICDRFDLTLECIRLWYEDVKDPNKNPLADAMDFSKGLLDFFKVEGSKGSENFGRYINFFLLNDLVDENYSGIRVFLPFQGFDNDKHKALPKDVDEYRKYIKEVTCFINARNQRISEYAESKCKGTTLA